MEITKKTLLDALEAVTGKREDDYGNKLKNHLQSQTLIRL